jgi:large subunit ribosomal protein L24e
MFRFCRSKCHKNFKAKRNPRRIRWTKAYRKTHGKELTTDPVYEFEKSRDTAVRYNRDVWVDTIQGMEQLDKIREDKETKFWEHRMKKADHHKKEMIKSNLIRNETLIADPEIREKVDKLREERDQKREMKRNRHLQKKPVGDLNPGLDTKMNIPQKENIKTKTTEKISQKKKRKVAAKQKQMLSNRNFDPKKRKMQEQMEVEED